MKMDKAAILVKKASLEFDKNSSPILEKYDLSPTQYKFLKYIYSEYEGGVRLVDLEKFFSTTHPTVIGLIRNLEKKGFVEYRTNPNHARSRLIYPTDKALEMKEELDTVGVYLEHKLTERLDEEEKAELIFLLQKMLGIKEDGSE